MRQLLVQLRVSEAESGRVPSFDELRARGADDLLVDPWGNDLALEELDDGTLRLRSPGPDGAPGTADDVVLEDRPRQLPTLDP